ncbi:hypothetical protein V1517DRAFT_327033 [Lipomyces orientalis]|uniref:Uncharacterized protein n=1 Tax=Lipomyces orientalis TaxID=1233043 RepID=A0ACC3TKL5_9ASCO
MSFSMQQQPKHTYGRRVHKSRHWQGLTDTELWAQTSPVKKVTSILPLFSPKSRKSDDGAVDNGAGRDCREKVHAERTGATAGDSPTKYSKERSANLIVQEDKENGLQVPRRSSTIKLKSALSSSMVESTREPLSSKSVNHPSTAPGVFLQPDTESEQQMPTSTFYKLPEVQIDLSDLSVCLDVISKPDPGDQVNPILAPLSSSDSVSFIALDEEIDKSAMSISSDLLATSTPILYRSREDDVPTNAVQKFVSPIIPTRDCSLAYLNSISSSPKTKDKLSPKNSPSREARIVPSTPSTPPSSPKIISPTGQPYGTLKGAPLPSSPLRGITNLSDLEDIVDAKSSGLDDLLNSCTSKEIRNFSEFIASFQDRWRLQKLGEASYSEVYSAIHNESAVSHVLKVMPFGKTDGETEQASVCDIANELKISKTLMAYDGFVKLIDAHVVQGKYSDILLELWDKFNNAGGSENGRPDIYEEDQYYCIIILNHAGTDLEHFVLKSWREAAAIFWRVARSLSYAEMFVDFEHRDLHWGNIVLDRPDEISDLMADMSLDDGHNAVNLKVTIIDYTLSRAKCHGVLVFTALDDPAIYTGKGDYQFDIYRFSRKLFTPVEDSVLNEQVHDEITNKGSRRRSTGHSQSTVKHNWAEYCPKTNILWLHYLAERLMNHKQLAAPRLGRQSSRNASANECVSQSEIEAYRSLEAVFKLIDPRKKRFAGKKGAQKQILCAQDLLNWGRDEDIVYC